MAAWCWVAPDGWRGGLVVEDRDGNGHDSRLEPRLRATETDDYPVLTKIVVIALARRPAGIPDDGEPDVVRNRGGYR
jgi:hypothetical protein